MYKFHAIGWTPLHCAVNQDDLSIVELLVENGAQIEFTGEIGGIGETPLHFAAGLMCGDIRIVSYLVEKGANIEAKDDNGLSPLHHSAFNDENGGMDERVPQYLIDHGAQIETIDNNGETPLHKACGSQWPSPPEASVMKATMET